MPKDFSDLELTEKFYHEQTQNFNEPFYRTISQKFPKNLLV